MLSGFGTMFCSAAAICLTTGIPLRMGFDRRTQGSNTNKRQEQLNDFFTNLFILI